MVIPDITFQLAKEDAQMALFSPYDVERLYGKPFGDIAVSEMYAQLVADERVSNAGSRPRSVPAAGGNSSLSPAIRTSCLKTR